VSQDEDTGKASGTRRRAILVRQCHPAEMNMRHTLFAFFVVTFPSICTSFRPSDGPEIPESDTSAVMGMDHQGSVVAVCTRRTTYVINIESGRLLFTDTHDDPSNLCIALSEDARRLAVGRDDGKVDIWHLVDGHSVKTTVPQMPRAGFVKIGGQYLVAASDIDGSTVNMWDVSSLKAMKPIDNSAEITALAPSRDGRLLVTAGMDDRIKVWNLATRSVERTIDLPRRKGEEVGLLALSPDASLCASGGMVSSTYLHYLNKDPVRSVLVREGGPNSENLGDDILCFSPDGTRLLQGAMGNAWVSIRNLTTPAEETSVMFPEPVATAMFSKDGKRIIACPTERAVVYRYDLGGKVVQVFDYTKLAPPSKAMPVEYKLHFPKTDGCPRAIGLR
jgi:WD40 repeat protein